MMQGSRTGTPVLVGAVAQGAAAGTRLRPK
jgi:hypothetical protein